MQDFDANAALSAGVPFQPKAKKDAAELSRLRPNYRPMARGEGEGQVISRYAEAIHHATIRSAADHGLAIPQDGTVWATRPLLARSDGFI